MGKSLHFEDAVRETIQLQRSFRCKNAVCETQTWKLKHQLDLAKFKVERLRKDLRSGSLFVTCMSHARFLIFFVCLRQFYYHVTLQISFNFIACFEICIILTLNNACFCFIVMLFEFYRTSAIIHFKTFSHINASFEHNYYYCTACFTFAVLCTFSLLVCLCRILPSDVITAPHSKYAVTVTPELPRFAASSSSSFLTDVGQSSTAQTLAVSHL